MAKDQEGKTCHRCPVRAVIIPLFAVFFVIFGFEWVFHGVFMMPHYEATKSLWRGPEEMQSLFYVSVIRVFVVSAILNLLYCKLSRGGSCDGKSLKSGICFGLVMGVLLGVWDFGAYAWLPVPITIPAYWFAGDVVMGVLVGITLSFLCRMCKKDQAD
jgi:hypothetical protein